MDQDQFRQTYQEINDCGCVFEKSVLTNQCQCATAERFCIAEREGVQCKEAASQELCQEMLQTLRKQAQFALRTNQNKSTLPHGKAIRIQVGGMRGLHKVLYPGQEPPTVIPDVQKLIAQARKSYPDILDLPYTVIMQWISAYQMKKRSRRKR